MTDRSLIFSEPMVRALIDGRKTQTRRLDTVKWMTARAGERIWVREPWRVGSWREDAKVTIDYCDGPRQEWLDVENRCLFERLWKESLDDAREMPTYRWRSARFMPRWASRLTLIVENVKVERVQDISDEDAIAEGCLGDVDTPPKWAFADLWRSIHLGCGEASWDANPLVAAISFRAVKANIDNLPREAA